MPATLTDPAEFSKLERRMRNEGCPAAQACSTAGEGFGVVCGVIERENREAPGEQVRDHVPALITEAHDPSSIHGYCTTRGYRNCPVWRAEQARVEQDRDRIDAVDVNYGGGVANRL